MKRVISRSRTSAIASRSLRATGLGDSLSLFLVAVLALTLPAAAFPQDPDEEEPETRELVLPAGATLEVEPQTITLEVGETTQITARVMDGDTEIDGARVVFFSRSRRNVGVNPTGEVEAFGPGAFTLVALVPKNVEDRPRRAEPLLRAEIAVTIPNPPVATVEIVDLPERFYSGTTLPLSSHVVDRSGAVRQDVAVSYSSSNSAVAKPDEFGFLHLRSPGQATLSAAAESASADLEIRVQALEVASFDLEASANRGSHR